MIHTLIKYCRRIAPLFSLGMVFVLAAITLPHYWSSKLDTMFFIVGFWFLIEATSRLDWIRNSLNFITPRYYLQNAPPGRIIVILGALTMIVSLFLPWFQTEQPLYGVTSKAGYSTNGLIIGLAGFVPLALAIFKKGRPGKPYSLFCALWGIYVLSFLIETHSSLDTSVFIFRDLGARLGIGPNIGFFGIILVIAGGMMAVCKIGD